MEIKEKLKKHKKKIIVGASLVGAVTVGIILIARNKKVNINTDDIEKTIKSISEEVKETQDNKVSMTDILLPKNNEIKVQGHKRKLPKGWIASESAKEFASHNNIQLAENETYVRNYKKIA